MSYSGVARRMILGFKHGDRTELSDIFADWMMGALKDVLQQDLVIVPVPIHWSRMVHRRYNQSAVLARSLGNRTGLPVISGALIRTRRTEVLDGKSRPERFDALKGAICVRPQCRDSISGRKILLIDDVMTTGATLAASADALNSAGADQVFVAVMARVAKDN